MILIVIVPVRSLTDADRARLSGYREEIGEEDLDAYFLCFSSTSEAILDPSGP